MKIRFSKKFVKRLDLSSSLARRNFEDSLVIFISDRFHPLLNNHASNGKYTGYRSINNWRLEGYI
jgi:hypothetical protein